MLATITVAGADILGRLENDSTNEIRIKFSEETLAQMTDWAKRYDRSARAGDSSRLIALGTEMFAWLDAEGWASGWANSPNHRQLEISVDNPNSKAANALLNLPWEILAYQKDYLAADRQKTYIVHRNIELPLRSDPPAPIHRDLAVMFMAAAPWGVRELDYEAEEAAILRATASLPLHLFVEESGCRDILKARLNRQGPIEVIHLCCHGDFHPDKGPVLALETPEGAKSETTPDALADTLGKNKAPLVVLAACRTAQKPQNRTALQKAVGLEPFVQALIKAGVANALGWDGSVYDLDATQFAHTFYAELARFHSVPYAAAIARQAVLNKNRCDAHTGRHWHMARVYTSTHGNKPLCDPRQPKRKLRKDAGYKEFLDKAHQKIPVAAGQEFVGRRREAQKIIGALHATKSAGVLLYGMGSIGKSSLAARVANRMPDHNTVVIHTRYDAPAIFDRLLAPLPVQDRSRWAALWRHRITPGGEKFGDALKALLTGPFDQKPILLIIDDLEQVLAPPEPGRDLTPIKDAPETPEAWRRALTGILQAFDRLETTSKLLLTSRYRFTLRDDNGRDLATLLIPIQLPPMDHRERIKQWKAARHAVKRNQNIDHDRENELVRQILAVAGGNPGLQKMLCRPLLAGEFTTAENALKAVLDWRTSGRVPSKASAADAFFRHISIETYANAITNTEARQLRAATLFAEGFPVPQSALEAVGRTAGVEAPEGIIDRLMGLGLIDTWGRIDTVTHLAVNPLARPLVKPELTANEQAALAAAAFPLLVDAWQKPNGNFPPDWRSQVAARIGLKGGAAARVLEQTALAAGSHLFNVERKAEAALELLKPTLAKLDAENFPPDPRFILLMSNCAEHAGETKLQIDLLERGLALKSDDKVALAQITATHATVRLMVEDHERALKALRSAIKLFEQAEDDRSRAVTMGKIADILVQRGETAEALRIRRQEQLPIYERLGDEHSRALTMGKIADILVLNGQTDEALQILQEELLPSFEQLGDGRERAITMGQIADILVQRGNTDAALRIHIEERLPTAKMINDLDTIAHIRLRCAQIRLGRKKTNNSEEQTIIDELKESYRLYGTLKYAEGIAVAGLTLGQLLAGKEGMGDQAIDVLLHAAQAFESLKKQTHVTSIYKLCQQIEAEIKSTSP